MAAGTYSFLALRPGVPQSPGHADVLSWRSVAAAGSNFQFGARTRAQPDDRRLRSVPHTTGLGPRVPLRSGAARRGSDANGRSPMALLTPFQTVGPFLTLGLTCGVDATAPADH